MTNEPGLPPHNRDAERSLLSSMLRDNSIINDIIHLVKADHFYVYGHQKIYEAITKLNDDDSKPADIVTVAEWLMQEKLIDDVGGPGYLAELWDAAPSAAHYRQYAEIIRQKAIVRNLIHACTEVQRDAYDQSTPPGELLDSAERRIFEIAEMGITGEAITVQDALNIAYQRLDARQQRGNDEFAGVPTGFLELDNLTAGFQRGELIVLAARPSVGKTAFALNIARHAATEEAMAVLFVSLEQGRGEIGERLLCAAAKVDSHHLRRGDISSAESDRIMDAGAVLGAAKLFIDDTPSQSMLRIAATARRLKKRHDLRLVLIDYLQLIDPDDTRQSRQEQVAGISRRLKALARELSIPVIALAQLNRRSEERVDGEPRLSDLRESGGIEQDADTVILLHRIDQNEPGQREGLVKLNVAKQRNGPTGFARLVYVKEFMRFENEAPEYSGSGAGAA